VSVTGPLAFSGVSRKRRFDGVLSIVRSCASVPLRTTRTPEAGPVSVTPPDTVAVSTPLLTVAVSTIGVDPTSTSVMRMLEAMLATWSSVAVIGSSTTSGGSLT
jgi:hypothetical protein